MPGIGWFNNDEVESAVAKARAARRPIYIEFWHPTCRACAKLSDVTYADPAVIGFLGAKFVSIKYNSGEPSGWYRALNRDVAHVWHPQHLITDWKLRETRRFVGYVPPAHLVANLRLGVGMLYLYRRRFDDALKTFAAAAESSLPESIQAEALYWQGVAAYRLHENSSAMDNQWQRLRSLFPDSDWAARADCLDVTVPDVGSPR